VTCSRNVGNEKYIQNLGRLETTSEYSFKRKDNIKICHEEMICKVSIEVAQVRIQRWRRVD